MIIHYSKTFKKNYRALSAADQIRVKQAIQRFKMNPLETALRNHKLQGVQKSLRSISAGYDIRLLYVERDGHAFILFMRVGTHDDVYE